MSRLYFKNLSDCEKQIITLMILNEEKESRRYRAVKKTALLKGIILTKMVILLFELLSIF